MPVRVCVHSHELFFGRHFVTVFSTPLFAYSTEHVCVCVCVCVCVSEYRPSSMLWASVSFKRCHTYTHTHTKIEYPIMVVVIGSFGEYMCVSTRGRDGIIAVHVCHMNHTHTQNFNYHGLPILQNLSCNL
jgi:hypothetical protein